MEYAVETEKRDRNKDRKMARFIAITSCVLLLSILSFIGYSISNPNVDKRSTEVKEEYVALDARLLEIGTQEGGAGSPAKATKAKATPAQMEHMLTATNSSTHQKSGNSNITNTADPNSQTSAAKYTSDNPFGSGGINGENFSGKEGRNTTWKDNQEESPTIPETPKRYLVEKPNTNNIQSDENCKITLAVSVDPNGNIVGEPKCIKSGSTTNDITLTKQVIQIVKNEARFNKVSTDKVTRETIVIRIQAN